MRQRYRRSSLGPFWLTMSTGMTIGTIALVFGQIFKSAASEFVPFLAIGIIVWNLIAAVVTDACSGFISAESIIRQLPIPLFVHVLRVIWRILLILAQNLVILPLVLLAVGKTVQWQALLALPGLALAVLNLTWAALILSILCARYRDLPQIVASAVQVVFYLTPII